MQNTFSGAYRLIHQNFAHCIRQCKWQLVRLRISQADCQASLRVPVDQKHFLSGLCQTYSQVRTGCCFANAAFLVGDGDDLCVHDFTSFLIVAVVSGNRKSRHFKINSEVTALSIAGIRVPEMKKAPSHLCDLCATSNSYSIIQISSNYAKLPQPKNEGKEG